MESRFVLRSCTLLYVHKVVNHCSVKVDSIGNVFASWSIFSVHLNCFSFVFYIPLVLLYHNQILCYGLFESRLVNRFIGFRVLTLIFSHSLLGF